MRIMSSSAVRIAGVMITPAIAIDGKLKAAGKVLTEAEITDLLAPAATTS